MKYEIKQLNDTDAVVTSNEEIKDGFVTNGIEVFKRNSMPEYTYEYANRYWQKVIATISPFRIEGLPMLELPNKTRIIDTFWLEKLCYYDRRSPDFQIKEEFGYDREEVEATGNFAKKDCGCDNCFYGRAKMAEKYISELPNQEEDVEKLAKQKFPLLNTENDRTGEIEEENLQLLGHRRTFIKGYKAAQKQYSEEDMKNCFLAAREFNSQDGVVDIDVILPMGGNMSDLNAVYITADEYLQSLQKNQSPISVELTEDFKVVKWYYNYT